MRPLRGFPYPIPTPRFFPKSNDTDDPRTTTLKAWPRRCSSTALHGTTVNSRNFSMTANLPLASRTGCRYAVYAFTVERLNEPLATVLRGPLRGGAQFATLKMAQ